MDDAATRLREALYTAVGFGVLGVQQAQVRRRDLQREWARLAVEVDERMEPVLDDLEARLPEDLRPLLVQARSAARSARRTLLGPSGPLSGMLGRLGTLDLDSDPDEAIPRLDEIRVFAGYAGWGPGQLEGEIEAGGWFVVDADAADPLSPAPEDLWAAVLRRQRGPLAFFAAYPADPTMN